MTATESNPAAVPVRLIKGRGAVSRPQGRYEGLVRELRPPDLMIYLRCSLPTLKKRVKTRGRPEEQSLPRAYLARLQDLYEEWFQRYDLSETLVVETDQTDYLDDLFDRLDLFQRIEAALKL